MVPLLAMAVPACAPPLHDVSAPALAQDRAAPGAALLEHALAGFFDGPGATPDPPTVCVELSPDALPAEQEAALMARFPRLAPRDRCEQAPGLMDRITGERAVLLQAYGFACSDAQTCTGWTNAPGRPATRWTMRWVDGAWTFAGDRRIIAQ
ncbi:hypothetical protein PK98_03155 [Croceibacterium mercuriale]|uniref:Uncharacterized protein n=1 Tax=Croceibacterium mercuriale TaxID=1572751 RepID=A0A0B2C074_9SPHN|nr:hypothetical protein PK98_03155 [Croceibacterium mercuriale]